jgi:hypothetical protein
MSANSKRDQIRLEAAKAVAEFKPYRPPHQHRRTIGPILEMELAEELNDQGHHHKGRRYKAGTISTWYHQRRDRLKRAYAEGNPGNGDYYVLLGDDWETDE